MFDIRADRDVVINAIQFYSYSTEDSNGIVEVYWRSGSYKGSEFSSSGWNLAYDRDTEYYNLERLAVLDGLDVSISQGSTVGFFIFMQPDRIRYENMQGRETDVIDDNIQVLDGSGLTYSTKWVGNNDNVYPERAFRGNIM